MPTGASPGTRRCIGITNREISARWRGSQGERLDYVVTDHLGTPREVFSEDGAALRWSAAFTLWGGRRAHLAGRNGRDGPERFEDDLDAEPESKAPDAAFCPIRFQGQWEDAESGLHDNRFRYYDPQAGSYLSPDPIGLNGEVR